MLRLAVRHRPVTLIPFRDLSNIVMASSGYSTHSSSTKDHERVFPKEKMSISLKEVKIGDVIEAIREKHPMLGSVLSTGVGFHLMYLESEIMMRVLEKLRHQNIVGLPVFDGVIVKASKAETAKGVMKDQFNKETGLEIEVRLEEDLVPKAIYRTLSKLIHLTTAVRRRRRER